MTRTLTLLLVVAAIAAGVALPAGAAARPRDPLWSDQWGPRQINAEAAWARSTGRRQVIAVVDTGVDLGHPDLRGKFVRGATFVSCPTTRPCGNGDWRSAGTADPRDGHGTHVAGIAAARTGNRIGIAGVAPHARIMPIKVLNEDAGTFADIAAGIRWATDHGADVVNLSIGTVPGAQALTLTGLIADTRRAIEYANGRGVVVVAAAGNQFGTPLCSTPAWENGALCVTATDRLGLRAYYSNLGVKADRLVVAAPGGQGTFCGDEIVSTVPRGSRSVCGPGSDYDALSGTSMAAPHVAGVAALLTAQGRSNRDVYRVLTATARNPLTGDRGRYDPVYGYGIVDAAAAVRARR